MMNRSRMLLAAIVLLALAVRLAGISFGLPHTECRPDESTIVQCAINVAEGDPNPHFFAYPSFMIYVLALVYGLFDLARCMGASSCPDLWQMLQAHPAPFYLAARLVSAVLGALSVLAVYRLGTRLCGRQGGLLAAFFLAVCYLHARDSHFGTTDVAMTCFLLLALDQTLQAVEGGEWRSFRLSGFLTGLAVSTKYTALLLPAAMAVGMAASAAGPREAWRAVFNRKTVLYAACCVAGFLLFTPFALLDRQTFLAHFLFELRHLAQGHPVWGPINLGRGWGYHAKVTLPGGCGWPLLVCGLLGIGVAWRSAPRRAAAVFVFPILFYLSAGRGYTVFVRYMLPVMPFLCLGAAVLLLRVWAPLAERCAPRWLLAAAALLVALPSLVNVARFDRLLMREDNRLVAARWLNATLPPGCTVQQTGKRWGQVMLSPKFRPCDLSDTPPDYIVVQEHPLAYSALTDAQRARLAGGYERMKTLPALDASVTVAAFDGQDAFYVPYHPLTGVQRPGPTFHVYRRKTF